LIAPLTVTRSGLGCVWSFCSYIKALFYLVTLLGVSECLSLGVCWLVFLCLGSLPFLHLLNIRYTYSSPMCREKKDQVTTNSSASHKTPAKTTTMLCTSVESWRV